MPDLTVTAIAFWIMIAALAITVSLSPALSQRARGSFVSLRDVRVKQFAPEAG